MGIAVEAVFILVFGFFGAIFLVAMPKLSHLCSWGFSLYRLNNPLLRFFLVNKNQVSIIVNTKTANPNGIHKGEVIHHQDQSMTLQSFRIRNTINKMPPIPRLDEFELHFESGMLLSFGYFFLIKSNPGFANFIDVP